MVDSLITYLTELLWCPFPTVEPVDVIASIDQGTQSSRVFLYDKDGKAVASSQEMFQQHYPERGWCEHDPYSILHTVERCMEGAMKDALSKGIDVTVKAVGITNQRETTICWSRSTGMPLYNAIVWLDTRTRALCHKLIDELGADSFRETTGLPISTYFSGFKMKWMLENVEAVSEAASAGDAMFGTVDSWLIFNLTGGVDGGVHVTDVSNASRTCLMDLATLSWSDVCCEKLGISLKSLPEIRSNSEVLGTVNSGPMAGIPIAGCLGDQQAALLGQRCTKGMGKNTYGTGCFLLVNTGSDIIQSAAGLLTTVGFKLGPDAPTSYALEGAIAIAGMAVGWLRDQIGLISKASEIEALAAAVPDSGGVYFVPAFSGLLAPYWRDDARGILVGISGGTNKHHFARAVLESMAFQTYDVLHTIKTEAGIPVPILRVDGGASQNNLLMQLQADIAQVSVERPAFQETTSLGAAFAAGLAVGFYSQEDIFGGSLPGASRFDPKQSPEWAQKRHESWTIAVEKSFGLADLA